MEQLRSILCFENWFWAPWIKWKTFCKRSFCQTPDLGLRLGVDFTFAWKWQQQQQWQEESPPKFSKKEHCYFKS